MKAYEVVDVTAELLHLRDHLSAEEGDEATYDEDNEKQCNDDGERTVLYLHLVLHELHHRIDEVGKCPSYEERHKNIAEIVQESYHSNDYYGDCRIMDNAIES